MFKLPDRSQSAGEEFANAASHGIGFLAALVATPFLVLAAIKTGSDYAVAGVCIFAASVMLLYFASTMYHALPDGRAKRFFRALDYAAIFLLIAGSYTPFTIGVLRGWLGWAMFAAIWVIALLGIGIRVFGSLKCPKITTLLYLVMGWLALAAVHRLWEELPTWGFACLVAGGVAYTLGILFFAWDRLRFFHFFWHLFVLAGTALHFAAVFGSVA